MINTGNIRSMRSIETMKDLKVSEIMDRIRPINAAIDVLGETLQRLDAMPMINDTYDVSRELKAQMTKMQTDVAELRREYDSRKAVIQPYERAMFERGVELSQTIKGRYSAIENGERTESLKRKKMRDAGVPESDIERLVPEFSPEPILDEIEQLKEEKAAWKLFNDTGLIKHLPANADTQVKRWKPYPVANAA